MTLRGGYALGVGESLEDLNMGGGSVLSLKVTGEQSNGLVTVIEGVALGGGPPLHVHEAEDEVVICLDGQLVYQVGGDRGTQRRTLRYEGPRAVWPGVACHDVSSVQSKLLSDASMAGSIRVRARPAEKDDRGGGSPAGRRRSPALNHYWFCLSCGCEAAAP
jgi:hypothetical protein